MNKSRNYHLCVFSSGTPHGVDRTIPLAKAGFHISFIALDAFDTIEKLNNFPNVKVILFNKVKPKRKHFCLPFLINLITELRPDALIVHFCGYYRFQAAILSGIKPVVGVLMGADVDIHDTLVPLHVRLEMLFTKLFIPYIELLAAKTDKIKRIVSKWDIRGKAITIPWGINIDDLCVDSPVDKKTIRQSLNLPEGAWIVLSPRRLGLGSRILEIVEGFYDFSKKAANAFLVIIEFSAVKDYLDQVYKKVADLGIKDKVQFIQTVEHSQLKSVYLASDVLVSNWVYDGLPQTFFEASLLEVPILASNLPPYHSIFQDGVSICYFDGSADDIAAKLGLLYKDEAMRASLGKEAREEVIHKADVDKWASFFQAELISVLENKKRIKIPKFKILIGKIILLFIFITRRFPFSRIFIKV